MNELKDKYTTEKKNLTKILVGSRMTEISYGETFNLIFRQNFNENEIQEMTVVLSFDAPCWFGNKNEWINKIKMLKNDNIGTECEDCFLAYELIKLRYNNLIQVEKVDFFDEFLAITFKGGYILSIASYSESDYSWILEEISQKKEQDRMMICCQGNELFQNNIPKYLQ